TLAIVEKFRSNTRRWSSPRPSARRGTSARATHRLRGELEGAVEEVGAAALVVGDHPDVDRRAGRREVRGVEREADVGLGLAGGGVGEGAGGGVPGERRNLAHDAHLRDGAAATDPRIELGGAG